MCIKNFEKSKYARPYACGTKMLRKRTETGHATSAAGAANLRMLTSDYSVVSIAYCTLSIAYCVLLIAYCVLPIEVGVGTADSAPFTSTHPTFYCCAQRALRLGLDSRFHKKRASANCSARKQSFVVCGMYQVTHWAVRRKACLQKTCLHKKGILLAREHGALRAFGPARCGRPLPT